MLFTDELDVLEVPNAYLIHVATGAGRSSSPDTCRVYAEHLYEFFDMVEQNGIDWRDIDHEVIEDWRNTMAATPSGRTGKPLAAKTINARLGAVHRFYRWAYKHGECEQVPFTLDDVRVLPGTKTNVLAHVDPNPTSTTASEQKLREANKLPRPLSKTELDRFFARADTPYDLIAEWMLACGLRAKEVAGLCVTDLPSVGQGHGSDIAPIRITITKGDGKGWQPDQGGEGSKPRTIFAPIRLIDRTQWYVSTTRARTIKRAKAQKGYQQPPQLFVTRHGTPITRRRIYERISEIMKAAGVAATSHNLRHTFAFAELVHLQRIARDNPNINPLLALRDLLGHENISSTAVYLNVQNKYENIVQESVASVYGQLVPHANASSIDDDYIPY